MKNKHRLIIDTSSILRASHYAGKDVEYGFNATFEGKKVWVNSAGWAYNNFLVSYRNLLKLTNTAPFQTILVKDGKNSRELRQQIYPDYKGHRPASAPALNAEYYEAMEGIEDEITAMGGTVMVQDGMEADDVIAYLTIALEGRKTVWSRDGDMLALRSDDTDIYLKDTMNPEMYDQCPAEYVLLYKALVGDNSDNLKGAKGFGKKTFVDMVLKFGYEGCDEFLNLLETRQLGLLEEDVAEFKPLKKVLANQEMVYMSYNCAKFYPQKVNTVRTPIEVTTGICQQWDPELRFPTLKEYFGTKTLVTADNFAEVYPKFVHQMPNTPFPALDLEASDTDEGAAWAKAIDDSKTNSRSNTVDVFGQVIAGAGITFGDNLQHTIYVSVDHLEVNNCTLEQLKSLIDALPEDLNVAVHNSNYELPVLHEHYKGFWLPNVWDTMDMKSHVDENTSDGLKPCARQFLGYEQQTYDQTTCTEGKKGTIDDMGALEKTFKQTIKEAVYETYIDPKTNKERRKTISKAETEVWERRRRRMNELTAAEVFDYGADDPIVTAALYNRFLLTMEMEQTITTFRECDLETSYWVAKAFVEGIPVNIEKLKKIELEDDAIFDEAWNELRGYLFELEWPGCDYVPYKEITPATIKDAHLKLTGEVLKTMVRKPEKLAEVLEDLGQTTLAEIVLSNDVDALNEHVEGFFVAEPEFDTNKTADVRALMYDHLKLPIRFRTVPTDNMRAKGIYEGTPQADNSAVEHALALDVEEGSQAARILELVSLMKTVETRRKLYYKPYPLLVHWKDGKLHVNLGKNRTVTKRFAPSNPNVNQLAKKGDGKKIRSIFEAISGYIICAMDFSGQELRLGAEESQDEMLLSCFIGDNLRDPHSLTGAGIAAKDGSEFGDYELFIQAISEENELVTVYRNKGKGTNFSSQYLCRAPKLAKMLIVDVEDAQKFLDAKNEVYWGLAAWQQETIAEAHAQGYVTTRMGGRRHLHAKLSDPNQWMVAEAERQAVNFKIQASGSEMTKRAINAMQSALEEFKAIFLFPVHDEAVFMIPVETAVPCIQALHACMIQPYGNMTVPLESEITIGRSFGELKKVGIEPIEEDINRVMAEVLAEAA